MEQDATEPLAAASGSADWRYHSSDGVNMWTWKPELGVTYMVTQHGDNIQTHLTTGTRYKYCRTIGAYATVKEAKARAEDHRQNDPAERPGKQPKP